MRFFGLKGELQQAVDAGMIVMAAAGNTFGSSPHQRAMQLPGGGGHRSRRLVVGRFVTGACS